jgi:cation/acetate symporter
METSINPVAVAMFIGVIALTLGITYWSARRSQSAAALYAAGGQITATQNGLAIIGDLMSAAIVLGGLAMFYDSGYDAVVYFASTMLGFSVLLALITGPMRRLGKFTFADVVASRLSPVPVRVLAAISALAITVMYLVAQMVGAGGLIQIMFGIPYPAAVLIIGSLMVMYVAFGGMLATTWVQIVKAVLMLTGVTIMAILALAQVGFDINELFTRATASHRLGEGVYQPGGMRMSPFVTASVAMAIGFGIIGLPHILMRFFTVPSPKVARRSMLVALSGMFYVHLLIVMVLGVAAVAFVTGNPEFMAANGAPRGGSNMVTLHLAQHLGGGVLFGFIAAVVFATILAVVAGLTVAASAAVSHDIFSSVIAKGKATDKQEKLVFRISCVVIGAAGVLLAIAFQGQNIIYITGMVFSIAASACFPVLLLSIYWSRLTTAGAVAGGYVGLIMSVGIIILGPSVWVQILGNGRPIVPTDQPAIISMPAAFIVMILVSLMTRDRPRAAA